MPSPGSTLDNFFPVLIILGSIFCVTSVNALCIDCTDPDETSISYGVLIALIVGGLILLTVIPILICFCCACCCFSGRNKNKTNVFVGGPGGQSYPGGLNQQINMVQSPQGNPHESYQPQNYNNSPYPSQQQQPQQYPYPSNRNTGSPQNQNQSPSYPAGPSYPQSSPPPLYPYPSHQSRLSHSPSKLPPYSPMNHSRVATPLVAQLSPYPPSPSRDYGSPPNSAGLRRAHSSAGYGSQPLYPSNNLTPSALGLQRSPSYLGAGSSQPFYPPVYQPSSGLRRSPSAISPSGNNNNYPQSYENKAYSPDMNQGYGFQNKY